MNHLVSIVIPTYNCERFIARAIDSALNQTYKAWEIIVVDDGSTDNTKQILQPYMDKIRYFFKENGGVSTARNIGIKEAKGEFIAFLDADDIWVTEKLELQMKEILKSDSIGAVSCGTYFMDETGGAIRRSIRKNYPKRKGLLKHLIIKNIMYGCSNNLVRKKCFEEIGLFDEKLRAGVDWDMWLRIAQAYDVKFIEKPLVKYRFVSGSISSPSNAGEVLKNDLLVLNKIFSNKSYRDDLFLKRKAYSYRYYLAALGYHEQEEIIELRSNIIRSFILFPFAFLNKSHLTLSLYALLGKDLYNRLKNTLKGGQS